MQFAEYLCHSVKMRPTIQKINTSLTYTSTKTSGCFSAPDERHQFQWNTCLICGNYICIKNKAVVPENIMCKDTNHFRYNYDEDLKEEIQNLIKLIEYNDRCGRHEISTKNKKMLAVLSIKLANDRIMNLDEYNILLSKFGLYDQII
jgi:hypothetical protein